MINEFIETTRYLKPYLSSAFATPLVIREKGGLDRTAAIVALRVLLADDALRPVTPVVREEELPSRGNLAPRPPRNKGHLVVRSVVVRNHRDRPGGG